MYTGTLIQDLLKTVERAEQRVQQQRWIADELELRRLYALQSPVVFDEHLLLMGAA